MRGAICHAPRPMHVAVRGGDLGVAHGFLNAEDACAAQDSQGAEGVAQPVGAQGLAADSAVCGQEGMPPDTM